MIFHDPHVSPKKCMCLQTSIIVSFLFASFGEAHSSRATQLFSFEAPQQGSCPDGLTIQPVDSKGIDVCVCEPEEASVRG